MQKEIQWSAHLGLYRGIAVSIAVVLAFGCGVNLWMLFAGPDTMHWLVYVTGANAVALAVLVAGFYLVRGRIDALTVDHERVLASVNRDGLTGAYLRAFFFVELKRRIARAHEVPVGYIQLDMDHLKQINDGNGHAVGDAALAHVVKCIHAVMPDAIVGRLGGDEFGIIVPGCGSKGALRNLGLEIREQLQRPAIVGGRPIPVAATMGAALAPANATSVDELISKADLALYTGKRRGRNAVLVFENDMMRDERHKRTVERELRAAILMDELDVYYQPIYEAHSCQLRSYESLVRWAHPVRGTIAPGAFIHIAEQSDLIDKLGDWVLRRVCQEIDVLEAPSVAINVSAVQLRRSDFAQRFAAIVEQSGVAFERLTVEVTETVPLAAGGKELANLFALRELGVRIAIDDFGAGNASLSYLKLFSFSTLKIDRSYVESIATNRFDSLLVASICRLARAANMDVIAEGIETEEQSQVLRQLGCTALQGYYYGRPKPLRLLRGASAQCCADEKLIAVA